MDYSKHFSRNLTLIIFIFLVIAVFGSYFLWQFSEYILEDDLVLKVLCWLLLSTILLGLISSVLTKIAFKPLSKLMDVIVFTGHNSREGAPPNLDKLFLGREMITSLARQVYDLSNMSSQALESNKNSENLQDSGSYIIEHIGLPIIGIDNSQKVVLANKAASEYLNQSTDDILEKPIYDVVKLSFSSEDTFENWLAASQQNTAVNSRTWEHVKLTDQKNNQTRQLNLIANFSKDPKNGIETILTIYDRTEEYSRNDGQMDIITLAVHELRTPLTIMRGYIEVFEEEIGPTLNPEMTGFMRKMKASSEQLTSFVSNILSVAKIEENQLILKLQENNWSNVVKKSIEDLELRARVHNKHIELNISDDLPNVAVDQISIHEVLNNLVDNAIKYSGNSSRIVLTSFLNSEGMIETSVQDFGIGIPQAVMPDLFQKFFRSHTSKGKVGGTGLGLFLSKSIITAHGGSIWVRSKEGEGSIFSFTVQPFDNIKHEQEKGQDGIMRGAHGWIKNHNLNRQ